MAEDVLLERVAKKVSRKVMPMNAEDVRIVGLAWADALYRQTPTSDPDDLEERAYAEGWLACVARLRSICGGESDG